MRRSVVAGMSAVSGLALAFSYLVSSHSDTAAGDGVLAAGAAATSSAGAGSPTAAASASPAGDDGETPTRSATAGAGTDDDETTADDDAATAGAAAGSGGGSRSASGTFTGDPVATQWGTVQVRITVSGGRITAADAVRYPDENHRDQEINAYAVPELNAQAVTAQSAQLQGVSGASVTSGGYVRSLQSAIDRAGL